eukprot:10576143-Alexandrium_andersonii.AAC.1
MSPAPMSPVRAIEDAPRRRAQPKQAAPQAPGATSSPLAAAFQRGCPKSGARAPMLALPPPPPAEPQGNPGAGRALAPRAKGKGKAKGVGKGKMQLVAPKAKAGPKAKAQARVGRRAGADGVATGVRPRGRQGSRNQPA